MLPAQERRRGFLSVMGIVICAATPMQPIEVHLSIIGTRPAAMVSASGLHKPVVTWPIPSAFMICTATPMSGSRIAGLTITRVLRPTALLGRAVTAANVFFGAALGSPNRGPSALRTAIEPRPTTATASTDSELPERSTPRGPTSLTNLAIEVFLEHGRRPLSEHSPNPKRVRNIPCEASGLSRWSRAKSGNSPRNIYWRRERDSNPRDSCPPTRFPSVRLQPLGHPSARVPHGMAHYTQALL